MFFFFASSRLHGALLAIVSFLAVVNCLCLPCVPQPQRDQAKFDMEPWIGLSPRVVYSPPITSPDSSTQWKIGTEVTVTWSTSNMPKGITNYHGKLYLGYLEPGSPNEHLDLNHPLAQGFDIRDGHRTVRVPRVAARNNYIVVLMGDSGNRSPEFAIV
ncbi:hypothetical protein R3P38DRAFT_1868757 [Favolaschia claudopus]|uniref:Purple acid phosphatase N-terminal domain-containing protein n=1 Tax=Favolaschia claudopus TaxID=2862362 RepID=A0AAW0DAM3_9AGAR